MDTNKSKTTLVTGAVGFIGYYISKKLLDEGWRVVGLDCMYDYYDVLLKERCEVMLLQNASYRSVHEKVETPNILMDLFEIERPNIVIHLAAQAGAKHRMENPGQVLMLLIEVQIGSYLGENDIIRYDDMYQHGNS